MRVFIGLDIPMSRVSAYRTLENQLKENLQLHKTVAYFKEEGQFHLTLQFLGEVSEDQIKTLGFLNEVARNFSAPRLAATGLGALPRADKAEKLFLNIGVNPALEELFVSVREGLASRGFSVDKNLFPPHVTIANLAGRQDISSFWESTQAPFVDFELRAVNIRVYQSEPGPKGSTYKVLQSVALDF